MQTYISDSAEYILFLICICGEIDELSAVHNLSVTENFARKQVMKLVRTKKIRRYKYLDENFDGNKTSLRLCSPEGEGAAINLSHELYWHWSLLVGSKNSRYKGTRSHKERLRRSFVLSQIFYQSGIMVDMLQHSYEKKTIEERGNINDIFPETYSHFIKEKTIFDEHGNLLLPDEILSRLDKDDTCYFTSRALSRMNDSRMTNNRCLMSRMHGMLIRDNIAFNVYYIGAGGEQWWPDVERQTMTILNRYLKSRPNSNVVGEGAAMIFTPSENIYYEMVYPKKNSKGRINPIGIYSKAHILPLNQNHIIIRQILLLENGETKLSEILLGTDYVAGEMYDGITKGYEVYNFLTNDLVRMDSVKTRIASVPSLVIINPWQHSTVKRMYPSTVQIIEITAEQLEELYEEILE